MAVGVVNLTLRGRYLLAITIVCFLLSQSLLGLCITSWSIYVCTTVSPTLYSEKSEVTFVFTVTGMYGTHVLFHNLTGIKICQRCYLQAHKLVLDIHFCKILNRSMLQEEYAKSLICLDIGRM